MTKIVTTSAFEVVTSQGTVSVAKGESDVPQEVADHFFVKAHLVGTPKGRVPVVEGPDGMMIEADEAGQRVTAAPEMPNPNAPPLRQEGPVSWSKDNLQAREAAQRAAEDAGTTYNEPVDGMARLVADTGRPGSEAKKAEDAAKASDVSAAQAARDRLEATRQASLRPAPK